MSSHKTIVTATALVVFFSSISKIGLSQESKSSFDPNQVFTRAEVPPKFRGNLSKYFDRVLTNQMFPGKGRVIIEVKIDTSGVPHFNRIYDHTDGDVSGWNLQEIVNRMPNWDPSLQNGRPVTFLRIIVLDIADYKLKQVTDKDGADEMKYMLNSNKL